LVPITPPAATRFSTTTGCPRISASFGPTKRAATSVAPPGVLGTTSLIGFAG